MSKPVLPDELKRHLAAAALALLNEGVGDERVRACWPPAVAKRMESLTRHAAAGCTEHAEAEYVAAFDVVLKYFALAAACGPTQPDMLRDMAAVGAMALFAATGEEQAIEQLRRRFDAVTRTVRDIAAD
jgi:hypothetical protein